MDPNDDLYPPPLHSSEQHSLAQQKMGTEKLKGRGRDSGLKQEIGLGKIGKKGEQNRGRKEEDALGGMLTFAVEHKKSIAVYF